MADRYWVGGTGNWNDNTNHWSDSSGGSPGASTPTSSDNVFFDANSFTGAGQTVTLNVAANCLNMDWANATNSPTFARGSQTTTINGSLTFISAMSHTGTGKFLFNGTTTGFTITWAGFNSSSTQVDINGTGGGWTLQDSMNVGLIQLVRGTLNTNNQTVSCTGLTKLLTFVCALSLGSTILTCSGDFTLTSTSFTLTRGTSKIIMSGATKSFDGGGLTYYDLQLTGTPITIIGSNTFNTLTLTAGKTVNFTAGTTQTISSLVATGTLGNLITIQSTVASSAATLSDSAGTNSVQYCNITDIDASGGAIFYYDATSTLTRANGWTLLVSGSSRKKPTIPMSSLTRYIRYAK